MLMLAIALARHRVAAFRRARRAAPSAAGPRAAELSAMVEILRRPQLRPLYFGMFALHFIMTATFLSVPQALQDNLGCRARTTGRCISASSWSRSPARCRWCCGPSAAGAGGALFLFAVLMLAGVRRPCSGSTTCTSGWCSASLTLFFAVFNYLEARLPALLTQAVPGDGSWRGTGGLRHRPVPRRVLRRRPRAASCWAGSGLPASSGAAPRMAPAGPPCPPGRSANRERTRFRLKHGVFASRAARLPLAVK